ncbi:MAG: polysaccharide biosynthesis protein [Rhodospirillaceae bacterium]|nr:polysaccharide biosynthesis protein [Rhodospirillaceae bacterium]
MILALINLSRRNKRILMVLFDACTVIASIFLAFSLRLGHFYYPTGNNHLLLIMIASPILALPIFYAFGFYREVIRYVGFKALWQINQATTLYAVLWALISFMAVIDGIPRTVILINWIIVLMSVGGSRFFARWVLSQENITNPLSQKRNVLIYGAGSAGRELCTALYQSSEYNPVAFVDNSVELYRQSINGLEVFNEDDIEDLIQKHNIKEVLLALPSISRRRRNEIIAILNPLPINVRSLPSVSELAQGKVKIDDLRDVSIKDLLGREPVKPNEELLKLKITGKVVLVTGAGGSIGSELCRQIILQKPKQLILYEINEFSLYNVDQEFDKIEMSHVEILPILGSVKDRKRFQNVVKHFSVQTIYHAAAYKHVPLVEYNNSEGVLNNTFGTLIAAEVALAEKVETFVLISTDKAVRPTNTMGATKRIAELVLQALSKQESSTCFTMVRFGNVLDSSGSVIPLFKQQIKNGGPVTVTNTNMVRYFMTIPEAVELVVQAGAMGKGGDVFVLDMGEPVRIYDLATKMIQLSGLQVLDEDNLDGDIEIKCIGLRPGEKLYEELLVGDNISQTDSLLIMRAEESMLDWEDLKPILDQLNEAINNSDQEKVRELLIEAVPEFKPQCDITDLLFKNGD